jgi:hypothetical protein
MNSISITTLKLNVLSCWLVPQQHHLNHIVITARELGIQLINAIITRATLTHHHLCSYVKHAAQQVTAQTSVMTLHWCATAITGAEAAVETAATTTAITAALVTEGVMMILIAVA